MKTVKRLLVLVMISCAAVSCSKDSSMDYSNENNASERNNIEIKEITSPDVIPETTSDRNEVLTFKTEIDYYHFDSEKILVSNMYISYQNNDLIANVDYWRNSLYDKTSSSFEIRKDSTIFEVIEKRGLKRKVTWIKNGNEITNVKFHVNGNLINQKRSDVPFIDLVQVAQNSENLNNEIEVTSHPDDGV